MRFGRRRFLALGVAALPAVLHARDEGPPYPTVEPGRELAFPRDFGSHPAFRTEWWYVTGWLETGAEPIGMQITFFRHRPRIGEDSASRFAPRELLFAHAALADPRVGRLQHDQRAARAGFGLAEAAEGNTDVHIGDWSLERDGDSYIARIPSNAFTLELRFATKQAPLLQGDRGYSRKGPDPAQASYYYSEPQLAVSGRVTTAAGVRAVEGTAWCDHEWSSEYLAPEAAGWDWTGLNFRDGSALMAFAIRRRGGGTLWAGGAWRGADGRSASLARDEVRFEPLRTWKSPRTSVTYPVAMQVAAGSTIYRLDPLFDDQELDARASTGTLYWEGAVRAVRGDEDVGRGYLELTGYGGPLRL